MHLKISHRNGQWWCSEVYTQKKLGYGTYLFTVSGSPEELDPNAILGFFTWDSTTGRTDANSELDVEFSRWCDPAQKVLQYSVHPVRSPKREIYWDRYFEQEIWFESGVSTHRIVWRPDSVRFSSFDGFRPENPLIDWVCEGTSPARQPPTGGQAVGIPRPGPKTHAHINLWLVDGNKSRLGDPPARGKEIELVIERFEFIPAE